MGAFFCYFRGKTVTAEAIVEQTRQPLYIVSAAELGTGAVGLEGNLRGIFDVAFAWNAVSAHSCPHPDQRTLEAAPAIKRLAIDLIINLLYR
jgi:hypothetical protein